MDPTTRLIQEQDQLFIERREISDRLEQENRNATVAERKRASFIESRLAQIDRELGLADQRHDFGQLLSESWNDAPATPAPRRGARRRYEDLFPEARSADLGGFESAEEYFSIIRSGRYDSRLFTDGGIFAGHTVGVPSGGGFTVPEPLVRDMLNKALESEVVRPRARQFPMGSETIKVAGFDGSSSQDDIVWGGLEAFWVPEEGTVTESTGEVRRVEMRAKKLAALSTASNELVSDSPGFAEDLMSRMSDAVSFRLDRAFIAGTGAGQPLGILNSDSRVTVAAEGGQPASTIEFENIKKMLTRLHPGCFANAVWLAHPSTVAQLRSLVQVIGTAGTHVPAVRETNGRLSLFGKEIILTEKAEPLGSEGDIILVDLSQYAVGLRRGLQLDRSQHVNFTSDKETFRALIRVDGQPLWSSAYQPRDSSAATLSWAVTLAAR